MRAASSIAVRDAEGPSRPEGASVAATPLRGLAGSALAQRFRHWRGMSGRRYLFSVFAMGDGPAYSDGVLLAVRGHADGTREILHLADTGALPELVLEGAALEDARAAGATEIHIHLLAPTGAARAAVIADLRG